MPSPRPPGALDLFSAPTRAWFEATFKEPTRVQAEGWPRLVAGENSLLIAPTGSGKTLAAFLWGIDQVMRLDPAAPAGVRVLYVSPLKALVYDIERNLRAPLIGIGYAADRLGLDVYRPRVDVRTGDTPPKDRRRQVRDPGEILVTTPESLYLLLGSRAALTLASVHTVIVDEIHSIAPSKRGVHLALSLERLSEVVTTVDPDGADEERPEPQRIGLSATVHPAETAARMLGGDREVSVVDASERPHIELEIRVPVADMENPPAAPAGKGGDGQRQVVGGSLLAEEIADSEAPREQGIWPTIYPPLLDLILEHRSTIIFTNSRGLCERLAQRLNDQWRERRQENGEPEPEGGDPIRAHHGSVSHAKRAEMEDGLKSGKLRAIVATSSLELGIDMGAVDLVVLVESPGSVASGLQRVGRAGHSVGEISRGVLFPKFRGDLLEATVTAQSMLAGEIEPLRVPTNALDVLAQQVVAMCVDRPREVGEVLALVRRSWPYRDLTGDAFTAVLDMLSGRYPSEEFGELRPRISWDRGRDVLSARKGAPMLTRLNAGTIPDRGLYGVHVGAEGPRVGELDEEMVHESRKGNTFILGASTWRIIDITRDRVVVQPAPGEPGRMPFWHGEGPGRPIELGRALGSFLREMGGLTEARARSHLEARTPLDEYARENLLAYIFEQKAWTGALPTDRSITVERFRDQLGDWRISILTPFGNRVHAPWAMAIEHLLGGKAGYDVQTMYTDDGIVLRFADSDDLPDTADLFPAPEDLEDLVVEQVGSSALFASVFRENAARALLLPRNRPGKRTALWLQRLRAKNLLAVVKRYPSFPIVLETYRHCLQDIFDLPALEDLLIHVRDRKVKVHDVETPSASPFARSLVFAFVANFLYEQDSPLAERRAQALTLDRSLLRELLGQDELRRLLDEGIVRDVYLEMQGLASERRARNADELHDLLRRVGDLSIGEIADRVGFEKERRDATPDPELTPPAFEEWLARLAEERRAVQVAVAGEERWIAAEDASRYRDALGVRLPGGLPETLLEVNETPLEDLVRRYARCHGPFYTEALAERLGLLPAVVEPILRSLQEAGRLERGDILPGGSRPEWCDPEVLRRIRRRTLAGLRREIAPVDAEAMGRFLPAWQGVRGAQADGERRRSMGTARLEEVIAQLEGLPIPWSSLSEIVLPERVLDFRPEMLDMMAASGEIVWVGCGALGTKDGKVALYRRDRVAELLAKRAVDEGEEGDGAGDAALSVDAVESRLRQAILERLRSRGPAFTVELEKLAEPAGAVASDLEDALWDLVWAGEITNDTFLPLSSLALRWKRAVGVDRSPPMPRWNPKTGEIGAVPVRRRARRNAKVAGGRWSLVSELADERVTDTERAHAIVVMLLERYGVVSREAALYEGIPGGFAAIVPVLQAMEDAGRIRRGWFVEGLSGRQYALPGAVDRLRAARSEDAPAFGPEDDIPVQTVASVDPANAWGSLLPWPPKSLDSGPRPRRVAGAWVISVAGLPFLFLEKSGRSVVTFKSFAEDRGGARALAAVEALPELARRGRRRSMLLEKIDGQPAGESVHAVVFEKGGFLPDYRGLNWVTPLFRPSENIGRG